MDYHHSAEMQIWLTWQQVRIICVAKLWAALWCLEGLLQNTSAVIPTKECSCTLPQKATRALGFHYCMQFMELSKKLKHLINRHTGTKLNKPMGDVEIYIILLHTAPQHWEPTYWISVCEVVAADWKKLIDYLKQIKVGEAIAKVKVKVTWLFQTKTETKMWYHIKNMSRVLPFTALTLWSQQVQNNQKLQAKAWQRV